MSTVLWLISGIFTACVALSFGFTPRGRQLATLWLRPFVSQRRHIFRTNLTKQAAEELLDWLESNGRLPAQVSYEERTGFTVRA